MCSGSSGWQMQGGSRGVPCVLCRAGGSAEERQAEVGGEAGPCVPCDGTKALSQWLSNLKN